MIEGILSNHWWAMIASDYSVTMLLIVTGIGTVLKIIAILKPDVKTAKITELLSGWVYGLPGVKEKIPEQTKPELVDSGKAAYEKL